MMPDGRNRLVIEEPFETLPRTAKTDRMLRRRAKILDRMASYRRQLEILERLLDDPVVREGTILEVACGMGFQLLELNRRGFPRLIGAEIDPALCQLTRYASHAFGLSVESVASDACAIPVATGSCSAVMSHSFFEHVYDRDLTLADQIRVLRPGGRLLIFDGNMLNPLLLFDLIFMYPLRTRGRHGGLKWMFGKGRVHENLYGYLPRGRDEDVKTARWWRRRLESERELRILHCGTGGDFTFPGWPLWARRVVGSCIVIAEKRSR
jgi:SAM-dependent methyltransferase